MDAGGEEDPPTPRENYIFPVDDTPILYRCFLKTTQRDRNMVIYIPLVKEPDGLPPNVKTVKYSSYKGISGYAGDRLTVIVKSGNDLDLHTVSSYEELIRKATNPIDSIADREMVRSKFAKSNIQPLKVTYFEDPLDIPDINDAMSSSQPVSFTSIQKMFLETAHLAITDFTLPFYALSDSIFTSLAKLEMLIKGDPELETLYGNICMSELFQRFTTLSGSVAGSMSLMSYIKAFEGIDPNKTLELQVTHSVFKGVVETVSKIHDKPEVQFLLFLLECLNKMKETLSYRGFDVNSKPYKMLVILETTFRTVLNIYITGTKHPTSGISQEKLRDIIIRAGKQFESFLRTEFQCPINPWVSFDDIPRARTSTLKKKGVLERAISGINIPQESDNVINAKLQAATHAVLDAVGPADLTQLSRGVSSTTVVNCNGFCMDGAPSAFDSNYPWAALFMCYRSVSCDPEVCKTPETIETLRKNGLDVFSVTSELICASSSKDQSSYHKKRYPVPHHKSDIGRYVSIIHPCYDISEQFIDKFCSEKTDATKTKLSAPFGSMYMLFDFAFPSFNQDPQFFLNGLRKFYIDVALLFQTGQARRSSVFSEYQVFYITSPFPLFVVIDGLLYVLVLVIDTINGGISNNMTMYLLCKKFKETNAFRGLCGSSGKCESLFRQSGCIVLEYDYFKNAEQELPSKQSKLQSTPQSKLQIIKEELEKVWSDTTCEIAFNAKELLGDQFKAFVADITGNILGQQCSFLSVDNCLIEGCSGTSIPLGLIRLSEFWKPRGTTTLPTLTQATVTDIARIQILFLLYGSFDKIDTHEVKITKLKNHMDIMLGKLSSTSELGKTADFLNVSAIMCHTKLKINIKTSYKTPILTALSERLDLFEKAINGALPIPDNMNHLGILRVYLVYLKHYYKVKADGDTDTSLLLNQTDFVSLIVDPITGPSLRDESKIKGYVCNDVAGFKDLVINPSATDKLESSETLMAHAFGGDEPPAAYNAIVDIIPNDTSLSEIFEKAAADTSDEQLMSPVKITIKMLLITFDIFQLLELLEYLEHATRKNRPIVLKEKTGLLGSKGRGLSLPYDKLISVLYDCIPFAFDIYIEDILPPPHPPASATSSGVRGDGDKVVLQHIGSIHTFLRETTQCKFEPKQKSSALSSSALSSSALSSSALSSSLFRSPFEPKPPSPPQTSTSDAISRRVSPRRSSPPNENPDDDPSVGIHRRRIPGSMPVRVAAPVGVAAPDSSNKRKRDGGSRKYTKRTKKFKRTPNKRNKTIRNKINTKYSLRNTIKRRKTRRRK